MFQKLAVVLQGSEVRPQAGLQSPETGEGRWYLRRLDMAATRAFRLIPLSARAKLSTSRWLGDRSSGVLQKERMVRLLRLRPVRAERKGEGWHWGWRSPQWVRTRGHGVQGASTTSPLCAQQPVRAVHQTL